MADLRRSSLRAGVLFALAIVALFDVLSLVQGVRSVRRLRSRVEEDVRRAVEAAWPQIGPVLGRGGIAAWDGAAAIALQLGVASEVEVLDGAGRALLSRPTVPPVSHRLPPAARAELVRGVTLATVVKTGPTVRALVYVPFTERGETLAMRLAQPVPDLEEEMRERDQIVVGHLASLFALALAAVLALLLRGGERDGGTRPASRGALEAYEQAMGRLRDRGEEESRRHEVERRRLEEEVRDKETMARAGELTAGMVHEVRNGLGTIVGYARLLERTATPPEAVEAAREIREECDALEAVVRRFTDFVRRETLQLTEVDLTRLLNRVVAHEMRGRDGVRVSLAALPEALLVRGDEGLLEKAFENLVRNAAEAALQGGGHVWLAAEASGEAVEVAISDDGVGLPDGHGGEIRPFFTTKPGGLGLGLPTARKLVRLHGGDLWLEGRSPRGLRVVVRLPFEGPGP